MWRVQHTKGKKPNKPTTKGICCWFVSVLQIEIITLLLKYSTREIRNAANNILLYFGTDLSVTPHILELQCHLHCGVFIAVQHLMGNCIAVLKLWLEKWSKPHIKFLTVSLSCVWACLIFLVMCFVFLDIVVTIFTKFYWKWINSLQELKIKTYGKLLVFF